jgi:hypothetical protein
MVTNAHRVEVEVGADGPSSVPPSVAAAVAPPTGADIYPIGDWVLGDRLEGFDRLDGIDELQEELIGFREVFNHSNLPLEGAALVKCCLVRQSFGEEVKDHACCFLAGQTSEEGGAYFQSTA